MNSDEIWNKMMEHHLIRECTNSPSYETEIFLVLEPVSNNLMGLTEPLLQRRYHIAFTSPGNADRSLRELNRQGVIPSADYRVLPTSFGEYFTRIKKRNGDLDLIIDPKEFTRVNARLFKH